MTATKNLYQRVIAKHRREDEMVELESRKVNELAYRGFTGFTFNCIIIIVSTIHDK